MAVTISFDPQDADDVAKILEIIGEETPEAEAAPAPAAKPKGKTKPAPAPEPEEEATSDGPSLDDAVARATELVAEGRAADVKGALANFGVKRVSELEESQVAEFLEALAEDSVV